MEQDLSKLCIHTITTRDWTLETAIEKYFEKGIHGISVWRNYIESKDMREVRNLLESHRMKVVSLVRGGFFTGLTKSDRSVASMGL